MKLVMTLLLRDESSIVRQNLLYHLNMGVDFIIATDNRSQDGTLDILHEFENRGVVHIIHEPEDDYAQGKWVSRMANLATTQFGADWVINNDADEFWCPLNGDLKHTLGAIPSEFSIVRANRTNFVPRPNPETDVWYEYLIFREAKSIEFSGNPLSPKSCHRGIKHVQVDDGNHNILKPDGLKTYPGESPIHILHFPLRSYAQFEHKISIGGRAYLNNPEQVARPNTFLNRMYKMLLVDELRAYYDRQVWTDQRIQQGLIQGIIVEDTRTRDVLRPLA